MPTWERVSDLLALPNRGIYKIDASATVAEAVGAMKSAKIHSILVIPQGEGLPWRIFTLSDARQCLLPAILKVGPRAKPITKWVDPSNTFEECRAWMNDEDINHLPVFPRNGNPLTAEPAGMVSASDIW
jgi:CBS domain-containing protein